MSDDEETVPVEFDQELFERWFVGQVEAYLAKVTAFEEFYAAREEAA